jgi:hypothetical protein
METSDGNWLNYGAFNGEPCLVEIIVDCEQVILTWYRASDGAVLESRTRKS